MFWKFECEALVDEKVEETHNVKDPVYRLNDAGQLEVVNYVDKEVTESTTIKRPESSTVEIEGGTDAFTEKFLELQPAHIQIIVSMKENEDDDYEPFSTYQGLAS